MVDLRAQFAEDYQDMIPTPEQLLESGQYVGGPPITDFEEAWATYCGVGHAVGTSSGTSALTASFMVLLAQWRRGCPRGLSQRRVRIITQANTFVATANAALRIPELEVNFIDCDEYFGMSVAGLQEVLARGGDWDVTIVVPVHMYGIMCDMQALVHLVNQHDNVFMVEDASHAHGSSDIHGRKAGSYGDLAAFSLFPAKPLGAAGDAGIVVTNQKSYAEYVRSYCDVGRGESWDVYDKVGFTYRLDTLQAVILRAKLRCLDSWRLQRQHLAEKYYEAWKDVEEIKLPYPRPTCAETAWISTSWPRHASSGLSAATTWTRDCARRQVDGRGGPSVRVQPAPRGQEVRGRDTLYSFARVPERRTPAVHY